MDANELKKQIGEWALTVDRAYALGELIKLGLSPSTAEALVDRVHEGKPNRRTTEAIKKVLGLASAS